MARIALSVLTVSVLVALAACGGSSSETPFPLEPDLSRLDGGPGGQSRYVVYTGERQKPAPSAESSDGNPGAPAPEKPRK